MTYAYSALANSDDDVGMRHISDAIYGLFDDDGNLQPIPELERTKEAWYRRRMGEMRWNPTPAEYTMALHLPPTFQTQVRVGRYIVDFFEPEIGIVVELDGASHLGRSAYDQQRDWFIEHCGYTVLHFTNDDVEYCPELVADKVLQVMEDNER